MCDTEAMKKPLLLVLLAYLLYAPATRAQTYCTPTFLATSDAITGFQLEGITKYSTSVPPGYSDYSFTGQNTTTALVPGFSYTTFFTGGAGIAPGDYFSIFVDADQNNAFEPAEQLMQYLVQVNGTNISAVTIPSTALTGYTRLRVMNSGAETVSDPCGTYIRGEAEDYTVVITDNANCIPLFGQGSQDGDYIDGVTFGTISNQGSGPGSSPYSNHYLNAGPNFITRVTPGSTSVLSITAGSFDPSSVDAEYYSVWIDLNRDGQFVPTEEVASGTTNAPGEQLDLSVNIPTNAEPGYTRMRVLCYFNTPATGACDVADYGEAEDYAVVIDNGAPCIPVFAQAGPNGNFVAGVQLADLNWQVNPDAANTPYLFAPAGAHLTMGIPEVLTITKSNYVGYDSMHVWIDWNGDGFDYGDYLGSNLTVQAGGTVTYTITPPTTTLGYARMRIVSATGQLSGYDGCSGAPQYANAVDFTLSIGHAGWPCLPALGYGAQSGDGIIDLTLQGHTYNDLTDYPYYTVSSGIAHRFTAGTTEPITITTGSYAPEHYTMMLDMNDDGDFDDNLEILGSVQSATPGEVLNIDLAIPAGSSPGQHLLRIRSNDATLPLANPCDDAFYGNMLDIAVVVEEPDGPCIPFAGGWTVTNHFIDGVELGSIVNTGSGAFLGPAYTSYSFVAPYLTIGVPNTLYLTSGGMGGDSYSAWIDLNADNDFDDANEPLGWVSIPDPYTTGDLSFTVPAGTTPGPKRMRVRCATAPLSDACASVYYGETEDYTVMVEVNTGLAAATIADLRLLPTADGVQLLTDASLIGNSYLLLDATGRHLATGRITADRTDLPMIAFARGAYTVQVLHGDARQVKRFVW